MKLKRCNLNTMRVICVILVVANHTSPFLNVNSNLDFIVSHILARIAVPFFLMIIGYFSLERYLRNPKELFKYLKRIGFLYLISVLIYLPITLYGNQHIELSIPSMLKLFFIDGTMYHLWYFPALIVGVLLTIFLLNRLKKPMYVIGPLFVIGLFGDSYYAVAESFWITKSMYHFIFIVSDFTRNGVFYMPMFLYLGYSIRKNPTKYSLKNDELTIIGLFLILIIEGLFVRFFNLSRHDSMYLVLVPLMYFLFKKLLKENNNVNRRLNSLTTIIYIIHPLLIVVIRAILKIIKFEDFYNYRLLFFLSVLISSYISSKLILNILDYFKQSSKQDFKRVYRRLNETNLTHNIKEINRYKHEQTEIMAVVKANGYGHGSVSMCKLLEKNGIKTFAVATLEEALEIRKNKIKGEILILGYTRIDLIETVIKHDLIQTIVSYDYAQEIENLKLKESLKCHLKINTGMNRLGEEYNNISKIKAMYEMKSLKVLGIFSHLAVADSTKEEDVQFTYKQIDRFNACIKQLESLNIDVKKKHLQGSYGFTNYPHLEYDYIRMGIMLYGIKSDLDDTCPLNLKPILSLCSTVTQVRTIKASESVSYGRDFIADKDKKIASIGIGYADGLSRHLSNTNYKVMVNNCLCPIIGRICMDQLMIDVSNVENIKVEDEVIIFGEINTVEVLAKHQKTITNDVLTSLTQRVEH